MCATDSSFESKRRLDRTHWLAITSSFFVTVLWSSSFIIIKFGLLEIPPLIFAGLRYSIASVILLTAAIGMSPSRREIKQLSKNWWMKLILYGLVYYSITMGTQFLGLAFLPALMVSFILNFTTILVVLIAFIFLHEQPNWKQLVLVVIALVGGLVYFWPLDVYASSLLGILIVVVSLLANSFSAVIGRDINRKKEVSALVVTAVSMSIGSILLLVTGFILTPLIVLSLWGFLTILWLSVVNTALAFTLWNKAMQRLTALESSIINSTMLAQIAILAIIFLGEIPTVIQWIGIITVMVAAMLIPILRTSTQSSVP